MIKVILYAACFCLLCACWDIQQGQPLDLIASGNWKGDFSLKEQSVPVLFEVYSSENLIEFKFKNGSSTIQPESLRRLGDTLYLAFDGGNTLLKLVGNVDRIDGFLMDKSQNEYPIPFAAQNGNYQRFPNIRAKPIMNITGEWALDISIDADSTETASLQFIAKENSLEAVLVWANQTIQLEGTVQNDVLYLSAYDGKTVYFFNAQIDPKGKLKKGKLLLNNKSYYCAAELKAGVITE
jgi:hypothetical protein